MNFQLLSCVSTAFLFGAVEVSAKLPPEQMAKLPPPASQQIDFIRDIKPIFEAACVKCHGKGKDKGSFSLETHESFLKGGDSGSPVVIGKSAESVLIELVSGLDPENVMPKKGSKLKAEQIAVLRAWIDQGAVWPSSISFAKAPVENLQPRKPELPPATSNSENPVDRLLVSYFTAHKVTPGKLVEDRQFARRVYLDVIGLLPSPEELDQFLADKQKEKRAQLVDKLLADPARYAEHWLTFWNDLLRSDYRGTGYIDGGRKQISSWIFSALATNMPYDQFVAKLINPTKESEGFVNGINWRGAVNASQISQMQAAQSIGQVFLGVNLKCASCHDSFINDYTLADSYGLAAVYATNDLKIAECDKPTGRTAKVKFLYPELGDIESGLPRELRMKRLAEILSSKKNGRLTRTVVNRLWAKFMGRGLVEPVDEMDQRAWEPAVLDWLAEDFADHGYDLKRTMRWILTSRAYQLPSANIGEQASKDFVFTGPAIRRISAEQFRDVLGQITGVWFDTAAANFDFSCANNSGEPLVPVAAKWIWSNTNAAQKTAAETIYFRQTFVIKEVSDEAFGVIACDNSYTLYVNGRQVKTGKDVQQPDFIDLRPSLKVGTNLIAIAAVNHTLDNKTPKAEDKAKESEANPAGLLFAVALRGGQSLDLVSSHDWLWSDSKSNGWEKISYDDSQWSHAAEVGNVNTAPWGLAHKLESVASAKLVRGRVRSGLVASDPMMTALARPNREQIVTCRASAATTLQALELTNGETLNKLLKGGAEKLVASRTGSSDEFVREVFVKSLGRQPSNSEMKLGKELVGSPLQQEGVEDLLWSVAMLPEFQLIY